jgi:2-polyprenyl-3-methyl-5-hydroxy-6-metoxy-1,4-benzoquinol methylase
MHQADWSVDGVDFDAKAIATASSKYGLNLRHGDLASAHFPDGTFDAVTLSHVIEHVPDPVALLGEVRRVLKPGGRMVVTTPNCESYGHREFKEHWFGLDAPRHLHIFSPQTLSEAGRRAGFRVLKAASTAASADIFFGASYSIRNAPGHQTSHEPPPNLLRVLRAAGWQYREHFALRHDPCCGEEALLIGVK